ncbi:solute carrier family 35 member G1-like [Tachypleus tridentatus]|uniref:solute carrier family 35 member G1-like n=1 Tax=Tachypleus tridentatus TaxID=6853 RepID=UPI003FD25B78
MDINKKSLRKYSSETLSNRDDIKLTETGFFNSLLTDDDESFHLSKDKKNIKCDLLGCLSLYKGLLFSMLSCLFFSTVYAIVKYLKTVDVAKVIWVNSMSLTVYSIPLIIQKKINPFGPPSVRKTLLCQSIAHTLVLYTRYSALHFLPIAEASVIIFSYPVMVSVFARIFLKESYGLLNIISTILNVVGVVLLSKLPLEIQTTNNLRNDSDQIIGTVIAFSSTVFAAIEIICTRWVKDIPVIVVLLNNGWVGICMSLIVTFSKGELPVIPCGEPSLLIVFCSLIEIVGLVFRYKGLQIEQAGLFSVVRAASQISFLFFWQLFFFKEIPDIWSISGVIILISCILCSGLSKYFRVVSLDTPIKRKF